MPPPMYGDVHCTKLGLSAPLGQSVAQEVKYFFPGLCTPKTYFEGAITFQSLFLNVQNGKQRNRITKMRVQKL